jgi:S-formylglutathione hydrolase FrmB
MKKSLVVILLINVVGAIVLGQRGGPPRRLENPQDFVLPEGSRIEFHTFQAPSLGGRVAAYSVYLPPSYHRSEHSYPVVYFLHGMWNDHTSWTVERYGNIPQRLEALILEKAIPEVIAVHPNGENSFYTDYLDGSSQYEALICSDLIEEVEAKFRVRKERKARSIGGVSMGGYGALKIALKHPELYSVAAGVSPIVLLGDDPSQRIIHSDSRMARYFTEALRPVYGMPFDPDHWRENSLEVLAQTTEVDGIKFYIGYGTADRYNDAIPMELGVRKLDEILRSRGADVLFRVFEGGPHGWQLVVQHFSEVVEFLVHDF